MEREIQTESGLQYLQVFYKKHFLPFMPIRGMLIIHSVLISLINGCGSIC